LNLTTSQIDSWLCFSIELQERWTPSTFFPQLDSVIGKIREELAAHPSQRVVFNLSALDAIDSSLITIIIQTIRQMQGNKLSIVAPHKDVNNWLSLLGINRLADMYESMDEWQKQIKE
jgi:anti-anti-sigma regulatory factor